MLWRPFDKPIAELETGDLERLRDERIEEQLFLEYKSEWSPRQIAKSIDAFVNTEGGTLVVGMTTNVREPKDLVGFDHEGDPVESLDRLVRASIAPRPDYKAKVVPNRENRPCLVVEVPRGEARPYLVTTTGQVMRRTQTGTEPATRDYLDRLFAEGRAGEQWARSFADEVLGDMNTGPEAAHIWTIPVVDGGLSVASQLFRPEVWIQLPDLASQYVGISAFAKERAGMDVSDTHLMVTMPGFKPPEAFCLRAETTGVVKSMWTEENGAAESLNFMIEQALPMHKVLTIDHFGFRGRVLLALRNGWKVTLHDESTRSHLVSITYPEFILADELDTSLLVAKLRRHVARNRGTWDPEP